MRDMWITAQQTEVIPYSEFQQRLQAGDIRQIIMRGSLIQGEFKAPATDGRQKFVTTLVDPALAKELDPHGLRY